MTGELILPQHLQEERIKKQLERDIRKGRSHLVALDKELKALDPYLELVLARPQATDPALIPGAWHVARHNPIGITSYLPITDDDGFPVEPHFGILDWMRGKDLQNQRVLDDITLERATAARERQLRRLAKRADRQQELADRVKAIESPGVSMAPGWTYRTSGRKASKEAA